MNFYGWGLLYKLRGPGKRNTQIPGLFSSIDSVPAKSPKKGLGYVGKVKGNIRDLRASLFDGGMLTRRASEGVSGLDKRVVDSRILATILPR